MARIASSADVADSADIAQSAAVWHLAQVREGAVIGEHCVIGRGAYIGVGVRVGKNCKIQNHALLYEPAQLGDGVFIGPGVVLTNDHNPRAVTPEGELKTASDWLPVGVRIDEGAAVGARAVCVAPVHIGAWALVAAGAVVTSDVPPFALVAGTPARRIGWVGKAGIRLVEESQRPGFFRCPQTQTLYRLREPDALEEYRGERDDVASLNAEECAGQMSSEMKNAEERR